MLYDEVEFNTQVVKLMQADYNSVLKANTAVGPRKILSKSSKHGYLIVYEPDAEECPDCNQLKRWHLNLRVCGKKVHE